MTVHLVSFVAGIQNKEFLVQRMRAQAEACNFINKIYIFSESDSNIYSKFHSEHNDFVEKNPRGYGYWLWKPYILYEYLTGLPENDIVLYSDIGCELSPAGGFIFNEITKKLKKRDFVFFNTGNNQPEYFWTKREVIELFNLPKQLLKQQQVAATFFLIKKNNFTVNFLREWLQIANDKTHLYLNDDLILEQRPDFIEHRHDQSILSLMAKKYRIKIYSLNTSFPIGLYYKNSPILMLPIHSVRNLTSNALIQPNMYKFRFSINALMRFIFLKMRVKFLDEK